MFQEKVIVHHKNQKEYSCKMKNESFKWSVLQ